WIIFTIVAFSDEPEAVSILNLAALLPLGLLVYTLSDLGHSVVAVWVWRICALIGLGTGCVSAVLALKEDPSDRWLIFRLLACLFLWTGFGILSFVTSGRSGFKPPSPAPSSVAGGIDSTTIWQAALPVVFGFCALALFF